MRDYEQTPRPNVEQHYHIRDLIEKQEKRASERNYYRDKAKEYQEREDLIKDAKGMVLTDFWCTDCDKDFKAMAVKQIEVDWSNSTQGIAFYKTKCFCGKWCIRLITDKNRDAYWLKSKGVQADRGKHFADLIQPYETNFNLLYGKR